MASDSLCREVVLYGAFQEPQPCPIAWNISIPKLVEITVNNSTIYTKGVLKDSPLTDWHVLICVAINCFTFIYHTNITKAAPDSTSAVAVAPKSERQEELDRHATPQSIFSQQPADHSIDPASSTIDHFASSATAGQREVVSLRWKTLCGCCRIARELSDMHEMERHFLPQSSLPWQSGVGDNFLQTPD